MSEAQRLLLVDTDMLVLLSATGLLDWTCARLGYEIDQLRRLPASLEQVRRSKTFRETYGVDVLRQIEPLVASVAAVEAPDDLALVDQLLDVMDPGEAQLLALAAPHGNTLLVTGDKRAIIALANSGLSQTIEDLKHRIVSLEALLWSLVEERSAPAIRALFQIVASYKTIRILLSQHASEDDGRCMLGIKRYFDDLNRMSSGLLFNPDPERLGAI